MKVADLFEARKKRKKKSAGFWWGGVPFAIVQSGTGDDTVSYGAGITGGGLSEGQQKEWLLPKGWVMTYEKTLANNNDIYHITRLMDDQVVAVAGSKDTNREGWDSWYFYTPNPDAKQFNAEVIKNDTDHMLRFKWWVTNQMVKAGILQKEDLKHAR